MPINLLDKFKKKDGLLLVSDEYLREITVFMPDSMMLPEPKKDQAGFYSMNLKDRAPYAREGSTAIIQVHGALIHRMSYTYEYATGYSYIRYAVEHALADDSITHIVFDIDSPGGMVAGAFELADYLFSVRGQKPMCGVVDSDCYSGAYLIASQLDSIYVTPTGGAGSIGVLTMHVEVTKMLENFGWNVKVFRSGDHKAEGNPYEELSESAANRIQTRIDSMRDKFVSYVARGRNIGEKVIFDTQAQTYAANDALNLGLIDGVLAPDDATMKFLNENSTDNSEGEEEMAVKDNSQSNKESTAEETNSDQKDSVSQERSRIMTVIKSDEYKGRENLANNLLEKTQMSAEEIVETLKCAPVKESAVETQQEDSESNQDSESVSDGGFNTEMAKDNPGVHDEDSASSEAESNPLISAYDNYYKAG